MILPLTDEMKFNVQIWTEETFHALGHPELIELTSIYWRYMYREVGASSWEILPDGVGNFKIMFAIKLWAYLNQKEQRDTVVHECCHIVDAYRGTIGDDEHGDSWTALMHQMDTSAKPDLRSLCVPHSTYYEIVPKCTICRQPGHNRLRCRSARWATQNRR